MELFQQFLLRLGGQIAEDGLAALLVADDDAPLPACGPCRPRMVVSLPFCHVDHLLGSSTQYHRSRAISIPIPVSYWFVTNC